MNFCTALLQVTRFECTIRIWEWKAINIVIQVLSERNKSLFLLLEDARHAAWEYRVTIHGGFIVKCTKITSKINAKAPQKLNSRTNRIRWGRSLEQIFLQHDDARLRPSAINSGAIRNVGIYVFPHLPFKTRLTTSDLLLFAFPKKHLKGFLSDPVSYL